MRLPLLVAAWYAANLAYVRTYRDALSAARGEVTLTTLQFALGGAFAWAFLPRRPTTLAECRAVAVLLWLGSLFTNLGYARLTVLEAMMLKATEPLFSVAIGALLGKGVPDVHVSLSLASLLYSGWSVASAPSDGAGVAFAVAANACLQARVHATKDASAHEAEPIAALFFTMALALPLQATLQATTASGEEGLAFLSLLSLPSLSCLSFLGYQAASVCVLRHVDPTTHSFLNAGKRAFLIGAALAARERPSLPSMLSAAQAVCACLAFGLARRRRPVASWVVNSLAIAAAVAQPTVAAPSSCVATPLSLPSSLPSNLTLSEAAQRGATNNLGNLVWVEGALHLLGPSVERRGVGEANECVLYYADANVLTPSDREHPFCPDACIRARTDLFRRYDRLVYMGAGIQMPLGASAGRLRPSNVEMMREAAARSVRVYVRGDTTRRALREDGVDVFAAGCPSLLLHPSPRLGAELARKFAALRRTRRPLRVGLAVHTPPHPNASRVMRRILSQSDAASRVFVQNGGDRLQFHDGRRRASPHLEHHYDVSAWRDAVGRMDLFVSGRIHGAMMAISASVPTIVLPNDARILELAEAMKLPTVVDLDGTDDVRSLLRKARFDGDAFDANRARVAAAYKESFDRYGIEMNPAVSRLQRG